MNLPNVFFDLPVYQGGHAMNIVVVAYAEIATGVEFLLLMTKDYC
ncbi:MAG: hypothetical protein Q8L39_17550 [Burkholderiales bacterium]|nr:hypothetical protein [Burkholderiales bacterium]